MPAICAEQHFGYLVKDLATLWREIIDRRLEPLGLSAARWQPLVVLYRADEPLTQSMLAAALEIEAPTLVRLLDRLDRDGWIERHRCTQADLLLQGSSAIALINGIPVIRRATGIRHQKNLIAHSNTSGATSEDPFLGPIPVSTYRWWQQELQRSPRVHPTADGASQKPSAVKNSCRWHG